MLIYNTDCFELIKTIKTNTIDMILTDPPYGMSYVSGGRKEKHDKIANDDNLDWLDNFIKECFRVLKDNTASYFFCSYHNIDIFKRAIEKHFNVKDILVWEKNNSGMGDLTGCFAPKVEFIIFVHKGRKNIIGKRTDNIFKFKKTDNAMHPTQKPTDLCEHMIKKFSDDGDIIFDPFMGSGTTGVSAIQSGRDFIGCEIDDKYFKIANERIKKAVLKSKQINVNDLF